MSDQFVEPCCGCCTIRTGAKVVGWLSLVLSVTTTVFASISLALIYYLDYQKDEDKRQVPLFFIIVNIVSIVILLFGCVFSLVLLIGIYKNNAVLVEAWLIFTGLITLLTIPVTVYAVIIYFRFQFFVLSLQAYIIAFYFIIVICSFYGELITIEEEFDETT